MWRENPETIKRRPALAMFTLAAAAVLTAMALAPTPAFADHVVCGDVITADTTLDSDIDCLGSGAPAVVIGADHVKLDLAGHQIRISGSVGVLNEGHDDVAIVDGSIGGPGGLPILLRDAKHSRVDHVAAGGGGAEAVRLDGSDRNRIVRSTLGGEGGGVTLLDGSDRNVIARNFFETGLGGAVYIRDSDGNVVDRNLARGGSSLADALLVDQGSDNTTLLRNVLEGGGRDGIGVRAGTTNTLVVGNQVSAFRNPFPQPADGIQVDSPSATLTRNSSNDNLGWGILAVPGVTDRGHNTASGNGVGQCLNVSC
jgi:hypothetical protein